LGFETKKQELIELMKEYDLDNEGRINFTDYTSLSNGFMFWIWVNMFFLWFGILFLTTWKECVYRKKRVKGVTYSDKTIRESRS
jgi:hypothetical protein